MFNNGDSDVMFYRPRLGYYSNQSKNAKFYHKECNATSYDWWQFVKKFGNTVVFNDHYYSNATSYHQRGVRGLLKSLKIKINITVNTSNSLDKYYELSGFLPELYKKLYSNEAELQYRQLNGTEKWRKDIMKDTLKEIMVLNKAGAKLSKARIKSIKDECFKIELTRKEEISARRKDAARRVAEGRKLLKNSWKSDINNVNIQSEVTNEAI